MGTLKTNVIGCVLICCFYSTSAFSNSFDGEWDWNNAPGSRTFSLSIKHDQRKLHGQYCAVAQNGNKVDCDDDENPNIDGNIDATGKSAVVEFSSFFGAKNGKAELRISGGHLLWHIIKNPVDGEFYAPKDAILDKH